MKTEIWNPTAENCASCNYFKPIIDKRSGTEILGEKQCEKFSWEISLELANKQPVCKIEKQRKRE